MNRHFVVIVFFMQLVFVGAVQGQAFFGIKGGINSPRLYYTDKNLKTLPHDFMVKTSIGVFGELPISNNLTLTPEVNYQQRGGSTSYIYNQQYDVTYKLEANYISLRIPLTFYINGSNNISPYMFAGPDTGYVIDGQIMLSQPGLPIPESHVETNNANMKNLYFGLLGGLGIRFNINLSYVTFVIKTDAALNWGLSDTFSDEEHQETANPTNVHAYNHQGHRLSRGLEAHISIGYISRKSDDVCHHFSTYKPRKVRFD